LVELQKTTPAHFWLAVDGWFNYRVQYTKLHGYSDEVLQKEAVAVGSSIKFIKKEDRVV
jgi:hypothetical protein